MRHRIGVRIPVKLTNHHGQRPLLVRQGLSAFALACAWLCPCSQARDTPQTDTVWRNRLDHKREKQAREKLTHMGLIMGERAMTRKIDAPCWELDGPRLRKRETSWEQPLEGTSQELCCTSHPDGRRRKCTAAHGERKPRMHPTGRHGILNQRKDATGLPCGAMRIMPASKTSETRLHSGSYVFGSS